MINIRLPFVFYHSCFMQPFSYFLFLLQLSIYGKCSVNYFSSPLGDNQHSVQKHRDLDSCPESLGRWRTFVDIPSCPGGGQQVIAAFAIIHNAENNQENHTGLKDKVRTLGLGFTELRGAFTENEKNVEAKTILIANINIYG